MQKKNFFPLILLVILLNSCKKSPIKDAFIDKSSYEIIKFNPADIKKDRKTKISSISSNVLYIPLETSNDILIGNIKKLIVWNEYYIIWDKMSESIICFSQDGKFVSKIQKQGIGPGEYPRISDFTIDKVTGNIHIYSDMGQGIYEYTIKGDFLQKISTEGIVLSSIAFLDKDIYLCYGEKLPNIQLFKSIMPEHFRIFVKAKDSVYNYQLKYQYEDDYRKLSLSKNNFSFFNDTILLTEFYGSNIYRVNPDGILELKYNIDFITNQYKPSFEEKLDIKRIEAEKASGHLASLYNIFFETEKYLFFNYSWGLIGLVCIDKENRNTYNMGFFIEDDFNNLSLPSSILYADNNYLYQMKEPIRILEEVNKRGNTSKLPQSVIDNLSEDGNPIIIKIRLNN